MNVETDHHAIVADIGGTHARLAYANLNTLSLSNVVVYHCCRFPCLEEIVQTYQKEHDLMHVEQAAIALACPVNGDDISMTNLSWQFSIEELKKRLKLNQLVVINDFMALALSLSILPEDDKIKIGGGCAQPDQPIVLLGPGTGLGVSYLVTDSNNNYVPFPSEAGHMGWVVETETEFFIHQFLTKRFGRVSIERVLSGPGLESLYLALAAYKGVTIEPMSAEAIAQHALNGTSLLAEETVSHFFKSLASFAGDLTLGLNAYGGVYLAGGIIPKLRALLNNEQFRAQFEAKGRFSKINKQIPTYLITSKQPGLIGSSITLHKARKAIA